MIAQVIAALDRTAIVLWRVGAELLRRAGVGLRLAPGSLRWWPIAVALAGVFAWLGLSLCVAAVAPWSLARLAEATQRRLTR